MKPWYNTDMQALYRAIQFLFNGIAMKLVKDHGKNHPTLLQVAHHLEGFLLCCHELEPLPNNSVAI